MASVCLITPDNFAREVVSGREPILILCMPSDEQFSLQLKVLEEIAERYFKKIKVGWLKETLLETFKKNMNICGTPTFLMMLHGKEINRMIGIADQNTLDDFVIRSLCITDEKIK